jgi:hypothetical protein
MQNHNLNVVVLFFTNIGNLKDYYYLICFLVILMESPYTKHPN